MLEAAIELIKLANVSDYPVEFNELIRQGGAILKAHEMVCPTEKRSASFHFKNTGSGVALERGTWLFISGFQIGAPVYAYALRLEVEPEVREALTQWKVSSIELLAIEQLKSDIVNSYREFQKRIGKKGGIKTHMISPLHV